MAKYYIPNASASKHPGCYYFLINRVNAQPGEFTDVWIDADSLEEATALVQVAIGDASIQSGGLSVGDDCAFVAGNENNYCQCYPNDATEVYPFLKTA